MSKFMEISGNKVLVLGDKKLDPVITEYVESDIYRSYNKYLTEGLYNDIVEHLIPVLNDMDGQTVTYVPHDRLYRVVTDGSMSYKDRLSNNVRIILKTKPILKTSLMKSVSIESKEFVFLQLPIMHPNGVVEKDGNKYTIISTINMDNSVTYEAKSNSIRLVDNENSIMILNPKKPVMSIFKKEVDIISMIGILADEQGGFDTSIRLVKSLRDLTIVSNLSGSAKDFTEYGDDSLDVNLNFKLKTGKDDVKRDIKYIELVDRNFFSTEYTRYDLNQMLSLSRAIDKTLSQDVVVNGEVLIPRGTKLTEGDIDELNANMVDTIFVKKSLNLSEGMYLADSVMIPCLFAGTVIDEYLASVFKVEPGLVVPKDIVLGQPHVFYADTPLTDAVYSLIERTGYREIKVKDKQGRRRHFTAYLEQEIINNRHFKVSDIKGRIDIPESLKDEEWVFIDYTGDVQEASRTLTCFDLTALLSLYLRLNAGEHKDLIPDADLGLRKKINQVPEHFSKAFKSACKELSVKSKKFIKEAFSSEVTLDNVDLMEGAFRYFSKYFWDYLDKTAKVIDVLDRTNPVATASSLTKVNSIVGDSNSIPDAMRRMSMAHYGRFCPYETPQSKKLGIVNNQAVYCKIEDGVMLVPYLKVIKLGEDDYMLSTVPEYMDVKREESYRIADLASLKLDENNRILNLDDRVLARIPATDSIEKTTARDIDVRHVEYVNMSLNQTLSLAATTVPFVGADDAARITFGLAQAKQAKGLVNPEIPYVMTTGFLNIVNRDTYYMIRAEGDGYVSDVTNSTVFIMYDDVDKFTSRTNDRSGVVAYNFEPAEHSSNSVIIRTPTVKAHTRVRKGDVIVTSNFVKDGILAIGVNAIIAYIPEGYNYEDAVPISDRIATKLTSYGSHTETVDISSSATKVTHRGQDYFRYLRKGDVAYKIEYNNQGRGEARLTKDATVKKLKGFICDISQETDNLNHSKISGYKAKSVSFDKMIASDKNANRHGNKGVTPHVRKNSQMYYMSNGEFIDVVYNQHGVASRMNIGQVLEANAGLACHVLGIKLLCDPFSSPEKEEVAMLLAYTHDLANEDDVESVFNRYNELPKELHDYCRNNMKRIKFWKGVFDKDGKAYLIDPATGKRMITKVLIGINYVYKLIQEGEGKLHSRGGFLTSEYVKKLEAPTSGSSKGGGQRYGYMELDALNGYGVSNYIQELMNERGDNYIKRNNLTVDVLHSGEDYFKVDERYGIRRSTEQLFSMLEALGVSAEFTDGELDLEHPEERTYYKKGTLTSANLSVDDEVEKADDDDVKALEEFMGI